MKIPEINIENIKVNYVGKQRQIVANNKLSEG